MENSMKIIKILFENRAQRHANECLICSSTLERFLTNLGSENRPQIDPKKVLKAIQQGINKSEVQEPRHEPR